MILTFVANKVSMLNYIIEACNSLLSLHDLSSLKSSSTIKLFLSFFSFFIKCMKSMTMTLSRHCVYAKLHVI